MAFEHSKEFVRILRESGLVEALKFDWRITQDRWDHFLEVTPERDGLFVYQEIDNDGSSSPVVIPVELAYKNGYISGEVYEQLRIK